MGFGSFRPVLACYSLLQLLPLVNLVQIKTKGKAGILWELLLILNDGPFIIPLGLLAPPPGREDEELRLRTGTEA